LPVDEEIRDRKSSSAADAGPHHSRASHRTSTTSVCVFFCARYLDVLGVWVRVALCRAG
jgi:hypothetical protein